MTDKIDPEEFVRGLLPTLSLANGSRLPAVWSEKLPVDTVRVAQVPAGVHLALTGSARALELVVRYGTETWRPAPTVTESFVVRCASFSRSVPVHRGEDRVRIELPSRGEDEVVRVYLPETVTLEIDSIAGVGGTIAPAPRGPRWVVYGDSIAQGWSVTEAGLAWPSLVAESLGLDLVNLGFAGAARGEVMASDVVAESGAAAVAVAWGTNSYSTIPADAVLIGETMRLFLTSLRQGLTDVPIVVISPIMRPDAESTPNRFGSTQAEIRRVLEAAVREFAKTNHDERILLLPGLDLVPVDQLADDLIHPVDRGHASLATAVTPFVAEGLGARLR